MSHFRSYEYYTGKKKNGSNDMTTIFKNAKNEERSQNMPKAYEKEPKNDEEYYNN